MAPRQDSYRRLSRMLSNTSAPAGAVQREAGDGGLARRLEFCVVGASWTLERKGGRRQAVRGAPCLPRLGARRVTPAIQWRWAPQLASAGSSVTASSVETRKSRVETDGPGCLGPRVGSRDPDARPGCKDAKAGSPELHELPMLFALERGRGEGTGARPGQLQHSSPARYVPSSVGL